MFHALTRGERGGVDSERKSQVARTMGNRHIKECMANYKLSPKCTEMQYNTIVLTAQLTCLVMISWISGQFSCDLRCSTKH